MKLISSKDNPLYKNICKVAQHKVKNELLLEGDHLCEMWLSHKGLPKLVILRESSQASYFQRWQTLKECACIVLPDHLFKQLNSVESPQGILFWVCVNPSTPEITYPQKTAVLLDRVQDPGNVGTIIRTCAALNIKYIYLTVGCANPWSSKVLRSAQGAHFSMTIYTQVDSIDLLEKSSLPLYITHLSPRAKHLYELVIPKNVLWVFGHEGQGVSEEILQFTHQAVFIPQSQQVESLNVGIASALALYEQQRQLGFEL
ncbi:RNA methyltransferase [Pelistega indica]|uniref:RNA methyltransferase n=1 Tax=Pelistega indica TaxID=1414851 RepID=V8G7M8_9BURK|nr:MULTISPECIES: RNA methyltransferase [Pelistega]ETD71697.1 RNA methyltransferase [Pelistega indica]